MSSLLNGTSSPVRVKILIVILGMVEDGMSIYWKGLTGQDCCSPFVPLTGKTHINFGFELPTI